MKTVKETIDAYARAAYTGDTDLLLKAFSTDSALKGYIGGDLYYLPIADFAEMVKSEESMESRGVDFKYEIKSVVETKDVAFVVVEETNYDGHNYIDYFSLARKDDDWTIAFKLFTTV